MTRIDIVEGGLLAARVTRSPRAIDARSNSMQWLPIDVRRFPRQLTAAANDSVMDGARQATRTHGEVPCE